MTKQNTEQNGHPAWLVDLHEKYSAAVANVFVLHFNVSDLFRYTNPLRDYLGKAFSNREIVVFYNISEGLTFLRPSMRDTFIRELGLDQVAEGPQLPPGFERLAQAQARQQAQAKIEPREITLPKHPREVLPLLEKLIRLSNEDGTKTAVIIDYAEALFPRGELAQMKTEDREAVVTLQRWARDTEIILSHCTLAQK